jgi:tetratricopeptide (TPR) repeat protein
MSKSQLITTFLALISIIGLAFLPKVVVKSNSETVATEPQTAVGNPEAEEEVHVTDLPEEQKGKAEHLWAQWHTASTPKDQLQAGTELVSVFRSVNLFDSAAVIAAGVAEKFPSLETNLLAGSAYYDAYTLAVRIERMQSLGEKTRLYLQKVLDQSPNHADAKTMMAMTFVATENPMAGIMMLREVLASNPDYVPAITNLGILAIKSGQFPLALERFERLVALDSNNLQAHLYRAICLAEMGKKAEAREVFLYVKARETAPGMLETIDNYLSKLE